MRDEIIGELWEIKDESAREADYDLATLHRRIKKREKESQSAVVDLSEKRRKVYPK